MKKEFGSNYASITDVDFTAKYRASCYCNAVQYEVCSDPVDAKVVWLQKSKPKIRLIRDTDQIIPLSVNRRRCESLILDRMELSSTAPCRSSRRTHNILYQESILYY